MNFQETREIETSPKTNDKYLTLPRKRTEALPLMKNAAAEERLQAEQLGSLARVVMETLGLTREEALQMAKDLGFQKR